MRTRRHRIWAGLLILSAIGVAAQCGFCAGLPWTAPQLPKPWPPALLVLLAAPQVLVTAVATVAVVLDRSSRSTRWGCWTSLVSATAVIPLMLLFVGAWVARFGEPPGPPSGAVELWGSALVWGFTLAAGLWIAAAMPVVVPWCWWLAATAGLVADLRDPPAEPDDEDLTQT